MDTKKIPVPEFFYSQGEWDRLGCGPLPSERRKDLHECTDEDLVKETQDGMDSTADRG
jgi:hypothetical protein